MQDAIILYENGKAIGGEGHLTDADDITFNNAGTDISANKVGLAIKEVNEKTKHGIVELWVNPSPTSTFAGQTLTFSNKGYSIDAVIIELGNGAGYSVGMVMIDVGGSASIETFGLSGASKMIDYYRRADVSTDGTNISVVFSDGTAYTQNNIGSATTSATKNDINIPKKILGLIHND